MYRIMFLCFAILPLAMANDANTQPRDWETQSAGKPWSIQTVSDVVRKGKTAIRFEVRAGDERVSPRSGKISYRAELSERPLFTAEMNKDYWYSFSIYIPKDFPTHGNRLNIGQWHASNDTKLGEVKRSPILSQKYKRGKFYVNVRFSSTRVQLENDGKKKRIFETRKLKRGVWHDFVYHVKWSHRQDGFVRIWLDGKEVAHYKGPVGYNDEMGPYFKYGIYRNQVPETYILYFDEYRRGRSFEQVDPNSNIPVD